MRTWTEIHEWRREQRQALIRSRLQLGRERRRALTETLQRRIEALQLPARGQVIALYWPIKAEPSLLPLAPLWQRAGATLALPVVVERDAALEFWRWQPGDALDQGIWNIPVPARRDRVTPDLLLAPLVGFDATGHRLGYGGGYYDRTLAELQPRPWCIGVGLQMGRLASIHPQAHDQPMDLIVTEAGAWPRVAVEPVQEAAPEIELSSPPCYLREVDPNN